MKRFADNLIKNHLYVMSHSILLMSKFFVFGFWQFDYNVSLWASLISSYSEFIELLWGLYSCHSSNLGTFQPFFLQIFSVPLSLSSSGTLTVCMLVHSIVSRRSLRSYSLSFNIFLSVPQTEWFISIILSSSSLILYSACSNLPLNSSSEFLISVIVLFSSRISFLVSF